MLSYIFDAKNPTNMLELMEFVHLGLNKSELSKRSSGDPLIY
jgi:hypothetical protein